MADEAENYELLLDFQANAQRIAHLTACLNMSNTELALLRQKEPVPPSKPVELNVAAPSSPRSSSLSRSSCMDSKSPGKPASRPIGKGPRSPAPVSSVASQQTANRSWTDDEHARFLAAHAVHGRGWSAISAVLGSRTPKQVRTYAQRLERRSGKRLMGRPKGDSAKLTKVACSKVSTPQTLAPSSKACSKVSRPETPAQSSKTFGSAAPSSPVTPKISFPAVKAEAALDAENYQTLATTGPLSDALPEVALGPDSMSFMSLLTLPVQDLSTSLLHRPESELELPFGSFQGMPNGDKGIAWDDLHDGEHLSLDGFVVEPFDDRIS